MTYEQRQKAVAALRNCTVIEEETIRVVVELQTAIAELRRKIAGLDEPFEYRHRSAETDCHAD